MPTLEQRQKLSEARKNINIELDEDLSQLKLVQKEERNKIKERHQSQVENLVLQKRKKFLVLKEQVLNNQTE